MTKIAITMQYPEQYRAELLNALQSTDFSAVEEILELFREARAHGRCIFVCGTDSNAMAAARLLCDMVRSSNLGRTAKFRIFAFSEEWPTMARVPDDLHYDHALVDELRNVASPGDVIVGINASGNSRSLVEVFEYANSIGCRTICIAGLPGNKLAAISDSAVLVPASHLGNIEDAHIIVCRMIGHYFLNFDHD
jgi:D-sedoheptulose 7-phosphate isomerase